MDELLDFTGKVALITGAGGGFGRLLAQGLAKRGCKLVISDINQANLDATLASLPDQNNAISMLCDVSKEQDCKNMVDAALMMMSPLIANAMYLGKTEERVGNQPDSRPGYCVYRCKDDDIMLGAFTANQHIGLFKTLGLTDLANNAAEVTPDWITKNSNRIKQQLDERFKTRKADHWESLLNQHDVPAAKVRDLYQMLLTDQTFHGLNVVMKH